MGRISPLTDSDTSTGSISGILKRKSYSDVILEDVLMNAIYKLNPALPQTAKDQALKSVFSVYSTQLIEANRMFHSMLTEGINVMVNKEGTERGEKVWLVDFQNPRNNFFHAVNQFTITDKNQNKRPDIILFINGLPLVVIELKNPADEQATTRKAYDQIQTYKTVIPALFYYNSFCIVSDGLEASAGTISSQFSRFMPWKSADGKREASGLINQLEILLKGMLDTKTLLDLIRYFIVFVEIKKTDVKTGLITIEMIKKIAAYHQYYAVNKAVESTRNACSTKGNRKAGVIWHTQGSGKSLSMVFYAGKLISDLDNPTIVVITDRNDLDQQLFDTFTSSKQLLRQNPEKAESRDELKRLLKVASGGIVFTTIQKFFPEDDSREYEKLSERKNIIVVADEVHRTQYGFKAKLVDIKDKNGNVTGKRIAYGFAKYLRDAITQCNIHPVFREKK